MIALGIYQLLAVNSPPAGGIHPVTLPEKPTYPVRTYTIVGGSSQPTFNTPGPQRVRIQFDDFGADYLTVATNRNNLRTLLEGYSGLLGDGTYLQDVQWVQDLDFFDSDPRIFRAMSEFYFFFS